MDPQVKAELNGRLNTALSNLSAIDASDPDYSITSKATLTSLIGVLDDLLSAIPDA